MTDLEFASLNTTGDITRLTMRRAPLNFFNLDMLQHMQRLLEGLGESPPGRVLVIDSDGAAFCAGLDLAEHTRQGVFLLLDQYHTFVRLVSTFPRPTIALVRGMALGAGNELAASCDYVIASHNATFGQPEIKIGTMPSLAPLLLPLRIGFQRAIQMILTGNPVDAQEAARIGLADRTVREEEMETALERWIADLRGSPVPVMELALRCARGARNRELETGLSEMQSLYWNELMDLDEPIEGVRAFLEKRAPRWSGK
jgi:cyclohexa-1,5-dienecarbonyl-CoA hydratase